MRFQTIRRKLATCLVLTMTAASLAPSAAFAVSSDDDSFWILDEDEGYVDEDTASDSNATGSNASSSDASKATASNLLLEEEEATPSDAIAEAVKSFNRAFAFVDRDGDESDEEDPSIPETGNDDFPYLSTTRERTKGEIDLADYDYEEKEYFISGTANTYDSDGDQLATASDADYVDRIIVFRPADSGDFNGKVYVEILNASSNVDLPDIWRRSYDFFMREGYIYIGVTSKEGNVDSLKRFNGDRYDALTWKDNGVIWDILGQLGTTLKRGGSPILYGTETAENCYLIGQSQSGMYVNGFSDWFGDANWLVDEATAEMLESYEDVEALEDAEHIYDGILNVVGGMAHVTPEAGWDMTQRPVEASDIPFILVVGENDYNPDNIREDSDEEGDLYRSYVFAGGAHSSKIFKADMIDEIQLQAGRPAGEYPSFVLDEETGRMNSASDFNMDVFVNAALKHLDEWAEGEAAPYGPSADEIDGEMVASGYYDVFEPERDKYGNMTTGIRSPQITVPVARYYGGANGVYSTDGGSMVYLDDDTLNSLYEDRDDYLAKYEAALDEMIREGWILEEDRALMMEIAETEPVLGQEGRNDQTIEETMAQTVHAAATGKDSGTTASGVSYTDTEYQTKGEANLYGVARSTALYMRRWYSMPYTNYMRIAVPDNFNGEIVLDLVFSGDEEKNIDEYMNAGQAYAAITADPEAASENGGNWEILKYADEPAISGSSSGPVEEEGLLWDIISQTVTTLMDGALISGGTSVTLGIDDSDADYVYTYAMYFGDFDAYQANVMELSGASVVALNSMDEAYDENAVIAETLSAWADHLYEPETTIALPATIVWPADTTARETAGKEVRPNTMIVTLDVDLNVYTLDGEWISTDLTSYLAATKDTALTAFYLNDKETADALSAYCSRYGVNDVIALASVENAAWVDGICDANTGVIGAVDFTGAGLDASQDDLYRIVTGTNGAHAKIAMIPENIATYESLDYLHKMVISVWVETSADERAIYMQLTNGANGIVCTDYEAVNDAIESFDGVTTLLRHSEISGHRGLPSSYIENTIRSWQGAIDVGADVIENDIQISADGEIFILHDDDAARLFNRADITDIEALTMAEIQALTFNMDEDEPNSVLNSNNTNRTTAGREDTVLTYDPEVDYIPTLREFFEAFIDQDIFFFIEIKTEKPEIVEPFKELCEEMGVSDRVVVITFHDGYYNNAYQYYSIDSDVMAEMQRVWPECSLGYLGMDGYSNPNLSTIIANNGGATGEAFGTLYKQLQPYNSTYHNAYQIINTDVIHDGRHRGLLANPWTYNTESGFAKGYLEGIYSLTTNFSNWATDLPVQIQVEDTTVAAGSDPLAFSVIAQNGDVIANPEGISLVTLSGPEVTYNSDGTVSASETGESLVMIRLDQNLDINGYDLEGSGIDTAYARYSNPFVLTVTAASEEPDEPVTPEEPVTPDEPSVPDEPSEDAETVDIRALAAAIETADGYRNRGLYTTATWNAMQSALANAKTVLAQAKAGTADQDAVDAAEAALTGAIHGLKRRSGGGSSGSGSSGGSGSSSAAGGSWIKDGTGWWYRNKDGSYPAGDWKFINSQWYYFGADGYMKTGWVLDKNVWYYLDSAGGHMRTGWYQDPGDGRWYYLDRSTGAMLTGWQEIDGNWYFFHDVAPAEPTSTYEESNHAWGDSKMAARPYGSMYASERTPDGYSVGSDGVLTP